MSIITKESIADTIEGLELLANRGIQSVHIDMAIAGMRRLLASLEAEPVAYIRSAHNPDGFCFADGIHPTHRHQRLPLSTLQDGCYWKVTPLYTAPPAPVSVPDEMTMQKALSAIDQLSWQECTRDAYMLGWNACRVAMLQGAEQSPATDNAAQQFETLATIIGSEKQ
ncbi:hypothetical protein ACLEUY_16900 [Enterobacter ludwigii]|uniref:hypothetical protein n=1 Tax=Enterobacter ludwigii TaxID=299767 RepID=UPI0039756BA2